MVLAMIRYLQNNTAPKLVCPPIFGTRGGRLSGDWYVELFTSCPLFGNLNIIKCTNFYGLKLPNEETPSIIPSNRSKNGQILHGFELLMAHWHYSSVVAVRF